MNRALTLQSPNPQPWPWSAERRAEAAGGLRSARADGERSQLSRPELERVVADHFGTVRRVLERLTGSAADAEDLAQECFLRARGALGSVPREAERAWLLRVAVHLARDAAKLRGRSRRRDDRAGRERLEQRPLAEPAEADLERRELLGALRAAIADLPERLRVPLVLRVYEGLDHAGIAERLGLRPATVRTQVMQARRELERRLGARLDAEGWR